MEVSSRPSARAEAGWPPGSLLAHDEAAVLERGRCSLLDEYLRGIKGTERVAANSTQGGRFKKTKNKQKQACSALQQLLCEWTACSCYMSSVLFIRAMPDLILKLKCHWWSVVNSFTDTRFSMMSKVLLPGSRKRIWTCLHQSAPNPCRVFISMKNIHCVDLEMPLG